MKFYADQICTNQFTSTDLTITTGEDKTLVLTNPGYTDIDFPILIRTTGAGIPTLETLIGNLTAPRWQVNDFNMCEGTEIKHTSKEGTYGEWHIHLITATSDPDNRYVNFEVEYSILELNSTPVHTTITSTDLTIAGGTTINTHLKFDIGTVGTYTIGAQMYPRLKRIASVGTAPSVDPFITMLQMHVPTDTICSRTEYTK